MIRSFLRKKDINSIISEHELNLSTDRPELKRTLGPFQLVLIGVGAIVGAGIFSLTGTAAAFYAGPSIVYSFMIAGVLCAFAGLCYSEMAAMIPVAGSAYTYSYATLGEFIAWIIGWDLILEYTFGAVIVGNAWSSYLISIISKTFGITLGDTLLRFTKGPWELVTLSNGESVSGVCNAPGIAVVLLLALVAYRGIKESVVFNGIMVFIKVAVILAFIAAGYTVIDSSLWIADPSATGFLKLIPPYGPLQKNSQEVMSFGFPGILTGTGVVFLSYIGFDIVSTTAQECKKPSRDIPIGILATLAVCTILYVSMSLVMTGVIHYSKLGVSDPIAVGIDRIAELHQLSPRIELIFTLLIKLGALAGLTSVILTFILGQSRIFYAMGKDGLLPWFGSIHKKHSTPHVATIVTSLCIAFGSGFLPISLVGELVSIGTLLAFLIVCLGIPILRVTKPEIHRPFRTPAYWFVGPAGALSCIWIMSSLPGETWLRLFVWMAIGLAIYIKYGMNNSSLKNKEQK